MRRLWGLLIVSRWTGTGRGGVYSCRVPGRSSAGGGSQIRCPGSLQQGARAPGNGPADCWAGGAADALGSSQCFRRGVLMVLCGAMTPKTVSFMFPEKKDPVSKSPRCHISPKQSGDTEKGVIRIPRKKRHRFSCEKRLKNGRKRREQKTWRCHNTTREDGDTISMILKTPVCKFRVSFFLQKGRDTGIGVIFANRNSRTPRLWSGGVFFCGERQRHRFRCQPAFKWVCDTAHK